MCEDTLIAGNNAFYGSRSHAPDERQSCKLSHSLKLSSAVRVREEVTLMRG